MIAKSADSNPTDLGFKAVGRIHTATSDGCTQKGEAPYTFSLGTVGLQSTGEPRLRRGKTTMTPRTQQTVDRDVPAVRQPSAYDVRRTLVDILDSTRTTRATTRALAGVV